MLLNVVSGYFAAKRPANQPSAENPWENLKGARMKHPENPRKTPPEILQISYGGQHTQNIFLLYLHVINNNVYNPLMGNLWKKTFQRRQTPQR